MLNMLKDEDNSSAEDAEDNKTCDLLKTEGKDNSSKEMYEVNEMSIDTMKEETREIIMLETQNNKNAHAHADGNVKMNDV